MDILVNLRFSESIFNFSVSGLGDEELGRRQDHGQQEEVHPRLWEGERAQSIQSRQQR